jgi:hypothetical protein
MSSKILLLTGALALAAVTSVLASPMNEPPPPGAILDLNGAPIPGGGNGGTFAEYSVDFTAGSTETNIMFAFRDDPGFILFEDASVMDLTTASPNLLVNGNFSGGTYTDDQNASTPVGWTYSNAFDTSSGGITTSCGSAGCWDDGAVQAYDSISQTIATKIGQSYQITFFVAEHGCSTCSFSRLSTNGDVTDAGGNGIDVLAYTQAEGLAPVPEPSTLWLLGTAAALAAIKLRKKVL